MKRIVIYLNERLWKITNDYESYSCSFKSCYFKQFLISSIELNDFFDITASEIFPFNFAKPS
jgi:hypothetical protein